MEGEKSEIVAADDMPHLNFFTKVTLWLSYHFRVPNRELWKKKKKITDLCCFSFENTVQGMIPKKIKRGEN